MTDLIAIAVGAIAYFAGLLAGVTVWESRLGKSDGHSALPWFVAAVCGVTAWQLTLQAIAP